MFVRGMTGFLCVANDLFGRGSFAGGVRRKGGGYGQPGVDKVVVCYGDRASLVLARGGIEGGMVRGINVWQVCAECDHMHHGKDVFNYTLR